MDLLLFLVVIVGVILLTVSLGAIGKHPVFRRIIGSLLLVALLLIPWVILIRLPYRVVQHVLFSVVFGGALINANLNVIGSDSNPIPGLYAVGNAAGGMYAVDYPLLLNGNSYGRALAYCMQLADSLTGKL